jgi:hypothetical protein
MTGNFVDVKLGEGISAFATFDKKKNVAYILIGVINRTDSVKVTLKNLTNILGEDLKISVDYVPYSYTKEGHSEVLINNQEFSGNILELGKAGKGDFYFIKISK